MSHIIWAISYGPYHTTKKLINDVLTQVWIRPPSKFWIFFRTSLSQIVPFVMNPLLSLFLFEFVAWVISNFLIIESFIAPWILSYSLFQGPTDNLDHNLIGQSSFWIPDLFMTRGTAPNIVGLTICSSSSIFFKSPELNQNCAPTTISDAWTIRSKICAIGK